MAFTRKARDDLAGSLRLTPPTLADGELVVDLIERIAEWPQSGPTSADATHMGVVESA